MNNREAAYKHFMQEEMRIGKSYQDIFNAGFQAALASQAQQSQWISVEERLPESKNEVLVFEKSNNVSFSFFDGKAWFINEYERNYGYIQRKLPDGLVTYWMPLPPAP